MYKRQQNDREINTFAARGLENLFSSCAVVSVFCSGGKKVLVLHTTSYVLRVWYHTVVVLCYFFRLWREIVFGVTYVLSVQYSCVAGKLILYKFSC